jgi:hypothetical protein
MLDVKQTTLRSHPNLLPLRMALAFAERESPSRPNRIDSNEQRALQLIARMQADHKKVSPFLNMPEIPALRGMDQQLQKAVYIDA